MSRRAKDPTPQEFAKSLGVHVSTVRQNLAKIRDKEGLLPHTEPRINKRGHKVQAQVFGPDLQKALKDRIKFRRVGVKG